MLHDSSLPKSLWAEAYNTVMYVRNRTLTSALDGQTPYKMVYGVKPDLADLRAFGVLCAIVEPGMKLKKLDDWASMCVVIGHKYGGGGHRVWDPCKSVVMESRDVMFFKDGLPLPTFCELAAQPVVQQPDIAPDEPLSLPAPAPAPPCPHLVVRLLGCYMKDPLCCIDSPDVNEDSDSCADHLVHDVANVPNYLKMSLRSGHMRAEPGGEVCNMAFVAGLPSGIQFSQMPDPRTAMLRGGWKLWTGRWTTCDLMTCTSSFRMHQACAPFGWGGFSIVSSRTARSTRTKCALLPMGITRDLVSIMASHLLLSCVWNYYIRC